ncbi:hypothetical protein O181_100733 [Austropuccinia psidii MF-1]|uniref:Uncharacterized protein n=1 Tax=Austropuccinia psidii MF-1 TaxID=1389203 RepID=A0A9Q3PGE6_9BASI|nr:hypothetical protein [Austropuccinia psidii MF-1]
MYGIDLANNKDRYFTIGDNKYKKFGFLPFVQQITVNKVSSVSLELENLKQKQLNEAEVSLHLTKLQESKLYALLYHYKEALESDKEPLGKVICHKVHTILIIERPYTAVLRRPSYPESLKLREALELHIRDILDLGVIRKVGHIEEV